MKRNAWWLSLLLGCTMSVIHLLPNAGKTAQSAVKMELPKTMSGWVFEKITPSQDELTILANDTELSKAICFRARPGEISDKGYLIPDRMDLSIVLSGSDLNNSIHRPERCMPAQGHNITASSNVEIKLTNGRSYQAKRLRSAQTIQGNKEGTVMAHFNCITYYFFVGHDRITNDHLIRTFTDMKDRLAHGMDQRWAYVSVSMWYGKMPWIEKEVTETEADEKLVEFLNDLTEQQIRWDQIRR